MASKNPLPQGTVLGKSYEYGVDVNIAEPDAAEKIWQNVRRISAFNRNPTPVTNDAQTYDDLGAGNEEVTGWDWSLTFETLVNRSRTTGLYLPEVEALRRRTRPSAKGGLANIEVRWYHKPETGTPHPTDAGQGMVSVAFTRQNTGADGANERWAWTLTGVGPEEEIANPWTGWGDEDDDGA